MKPDGTNLWYLNLDYSILQYSSFEIPVRSTTLGCKDIEIRKLEFVAKTHEFETIENLQTINLQLLPPPSFLFDYHVSEYDKPALQY